MKKRSVERRFDRYAREMMSINLKCVLWIGLSLLIYDFVYTHSLNADLAFTIGLAHLFITFGFVFPYMSFLLKWSYGKKAQPIDEFILRCFCPFLLLINYGHARARYLRYQIIGEHIFNQDPYKNKLKEIEQVKQQANLKVRLIKNNIKRDTAKERRRLEKLLTWARKRKEKFYLEKFVTVARAISLHIREIEDHCHFAEENLNGLFFRYQYAFPSHQQLIKDKYRYRMTPSDYDPQLPNISPKQSTLEGKLLYLAVLIRSQRDNHYDRLDFEKSDFTVGRYVYSQSRSAIDISHWRRHLPAINAYLGGEWMVEPLDGTSLVLSQLKDLPSLIAFQDEFLRKGEVFYGFNVRTGDRYYNDLEKLPHHLVVGQSGSGKSVFLNQIMASVLYNIDAFEKVYLVDLKGGVELAKYALLHEALQLVDDYDDLPDIAAEIYQTLRHRLKHMRETGKTVFEGKHILFIVDEYAQINQFEPITKEEKEKHKQLLSYLNRISQLGRAARVTIWAQLQKATVDNISASFRNNLQTKICFKVHSNSDAATVFGNTEHLPGVASLGGFKNLAKGRFILSDDISGEDIYMQAAMLDDEIPLARLLQTAGEARVVSERQADERVSEAE